jgi:hypothetical protein
MKRRNQIEILGNIDGIDGVNDLGMKQDGSVAVGFKINSNAEFFSAMVQMLHARFRKRDRNILQ